MDPTRDSARPPQDAHMQPPAGLHPMLLSTEAGFSTMPMGFWNDSPMQTGPLGNPTETPLGLPPPHQQHFSQQHFSQQHFPQQQTSQELQTNPPFAPQRSSSPEPQVGRQGRRKGQHPGLDEESTMMVTDSNPNFLGRSGDMGIGGMNVSMGGMNVSMGSMLNIKMEMTPNASTDIPRTDWNKLSSGSMLDSAELSAAARTFVRPPGGDGIIHDVPRSGGSAENSAEKEKTGGNVIIMTPIHIGGISVPNRLNQRDKHDAQMDIDLRNSMDALRVSNDYTYSTGAAGKFFGDNNGDRELNRPFVVPNMHASPAQTPSASLLTSASSSATAVASSSISASASSSSSSSSSTTLSSSSSSFSSLAAITQDKSIKQVLFTSPSSSSSSSSPSAASSSASPFSSSVLVRLTGTSGQLSSALPAAPSSSSAASASIVVSSSTSLSSSLSMPAGAVPGVPGVSTCAERGDGETIKRKMIVKKKKKERKKGSGCFCKKSQCVKLYCECYAKGKFCTDVCQCSGCINCEGEETKEAREQRVRAALQKNGKAFFRSAAEDGIVPPFKGCKCKRSQCQKNYCECYQAGVQCVATCRCVDCENNKDNNASPPPMEQRRHSRTADTYDVSTESNSSSSLSSASSLSSSAAAAAASSSLSRRPTKKRQIPNSARNMTAQETDKRGRGEDMSGDEDSEDDEDENEDEDEDNEDGEEDENEDEDEQYEDDFEEDVPVYHAPHE